jgi:flagellar biosynthesis GTPase FlhF
MLTNEQISFLSNEMNISKEIVQSVFENDSQNVYNTCHFIMCDESGREETDEYDLERFCKAEEIYFMIK